jgi:hypothetical protein
MWGDRSNMKTLNPMIHELLWQHNDSNVEQLLAFAKETGDPKFLKTLSQKTPARTFNRCLHELQAQNKVRCLDPFFGNYDPNVKPALPRWHAFPEGF